MWVLPLQYEKQHSILWLLQESLVQQMSPTHLLHNVPVFGQENHTSFSTSLYQRARKIASCVPAGDALRPKEGIMHMKITWKTVQRGVFKVHARCGVGTRWAPLSQRKDCRQMCLKMGDLSTKWPELGNKWSKRRHNGSPWEMNAQTNQENCVFHLCGGCGAVWRACTGMLEPIGGHYPHNGYTPALTFYTPALTCGNGGDLGVFCP